MATTISGHVMLRCWPLGPWPHGKALRFALAGAGRSACVTLAACQPVTSRALGLVVTAAHEIARRLAGLGAAVVGPCACGSDPADCACGAGADRHVLVLVIDATPLHPAAERWAGDLIARHGDDGVVLCALTSAVTHRAVFGGGTHPRLARRTAVTWHDDPARLADAALAAALDDERPGVFVSYARADASDAADALHDALARAGFRVFVDRFSGTAGRHFPDELREAMSDMGLVLVLESPALAASGWTQREAAFARRYRIGPVTLHFTGAPRLPFAWDRKHMGAPVATPLAPGVVDDVVRFVRERRGAVAAYRRAFFETLVDAAARDGGGAASLGGDAITIEKPLGTERARALVSARPGQLWHVHRLVDASGPGAPPLLLAGEHDHLPSRDRRALRWLAARHGVTLAGSASVYRAVRRLV